MGVDVALKNCPYFRFTFVVQPETLDEVAKVGMRGRCIRCNAQWVESVCNSRDKLIDIILFPMSSGASERGGARERSGAVRSKRMRERCERTNERCERMAQYPMR